MGDHFLKANNSLHLAYPHAHSLSFSLSSSFSPSPVLCLFYSLRFHKHAYALGEHYNSIVPIVASEETEDTE